MPVIGITGGISTGKTSFCERLREFAPEATFFDADRAARDLGDKDAEVRALIEKEFGASAILRAWAEPGAIRTIVFADAERTRAGAILHPRSAVSGASKAEGVATHQAFFC